MSFNGYDVIIPGGIISVGRALLSAHIRKDVMTRREWLSRMTHQ
jgi:hypothetical protein